MELNIMEIIIVKYSRLGTRTLGGYKKVVFDGFAGYMPRTYATDIPFVVSIFYYDKYLFISFHNRIIMYLNFIKY